MTAKIGIGVLAAVRAAVLAAALAAGAGAACAQGAGSEKFPARGGRIIVPFAAGSILDGQARIIAEALTHKWGHPVIVENVAGSGGNVGTERFARSPGDGYTLLAAPPGPFTINRLLYKSTGYDAEKFVPVTLMSTVPNVLVVRANFPARTFAEFIAYARKSPGKTTYASQGVGTTPFLAAKRLEIAAGVSMVHVPYRGSALALADITAGHVDSFFDAISNALPLMRAGKVRILAITDTKRSPLLPDVPSVAESLPGFRSISWFALAAPPGTPTSIRDRISADVAQIIADKDTNAKLRAMGLTPVGNTPNELANFIREENVAWTKVIRDVGLQPQ